MTTSAIVLINDLPLATSGVTGANVTPGSTVLVTLANPSNVANWVLSVLNSDGYNPNTAVNLVSETLVRTGTTTYTFTAPALWGNIGGSNIFKSLTTDADDNENIFTFGIWEIGTNASRTFIGGENLESNITVGVAYDLNALVAKAAATGGGSGGSPTGPASGDLGGYYPMPKVTGLQGFAIDPSTPTVGEVLQYNVDGLWTPTPLGSLSTVNIFGDVTGTNLASTVVKLQGNKIKPITLSSSNDGYVATWVNADGYIEFKPLGSSGITQLTGDGYAGPGAGSQVLTLATVNSNVGTFGSTTTIPIVTVNGKGLITAVSTTSITSGINQLTGDASAGPGTGSQAITLATVNSNVGTFGSSTTIPIVTVNGKGLITGVTTTSVVSGINQLTGDVLSGPGTGSQAATLATVNSNVGSFGSSTLVPVFTVNAKGLITSASSVSYTGGAAPTGAAGGDLSGTYPNPNVSSITGSGSVSNCRIGTETSLLWDAGTANGYANIGISPTTVTNGSSLTIRAQNTTYSTGTGGDLLLYSGAGGFEGGNIILTGGTATSDPAGDIELIGGHSDGSIGGTIQIRAGNSGITSGGISLVVNPLSDDGYTQSGIGITYLGTSIYNLSTGIVHSNSSGFLTSSAVNLASSDVTGILPLGNLQHGYDAQILLINGFTPTWTNLSQDVTISDTGATTVGQLQGSIVLSGTPSSGNVLTATSSTAAHWAAPAAGGITQLTGDASAGPGSGSQALTLATVNSNVGSFGDATHVGSFTVNAKGLITAASSVSITGIPPGGAAGGDLAGTYPNPTLAKIDGYSLPSPTPGVLQDVAGSLGWGSVNLASSTFVSGILPIANQANQNMIGDVVGTTGANKVATINGLSIYNYQFLLMGA